MWCPNIGRERRARELNSKRLPTSGGLSPGLVPTSNTLLKSQIVVSLCLPMRSRPGKRTGL